MADIRIVETTADSVAAELTRHGLDPDDKVTVVIDMEGGRLPGRRGSRARVIAAGLSDEDIDRLIEEAREEVYQMRK
jgi:hypothetical protein